MQNPRSKSVRALILLVVVLFLLGLLATPIVTAAVVLNYFEVVWDPDLETVSISWETATEFETSGFKVERATSPTGTFSVIGEFVPATGDQVTGATYGPYFDTDTITNTTYWYQLVVYDRSGQADRSIPKAAVISGNPNTPTPTPTNTPTVTPGGSGWQPSATPTPTPTATSSRTPTATFTPPPTNTPTPGPSPTRTATVPIGATVTPILSSASNGTFTPTPLPILVNNTLVAPTRSVIATPTPLPPLPQPVTEIAQRLPVATSTPLPSRPVPTLVATDATFVPVAPIIIATPVEISDATHSNNSAGNRLALIGAAGLLLLGGLYLILRQSSK